ncbi:protein of unknown function [Burkholderia multivorans]
MRDESILRIYKAIRRPALRVAARQDISARWFEAQEPDCEPGPAERHYLPE